MFEARAQLTRTNAKIVRKIDSCGRTEHANQWCCPYVHHCWKFCSSTCLLRTTITVYGPYDRGRHSKQLLLCRRPYGFGIHAPAEEYAGQRFRQGSVGLHHHCFRARERADVDEAYDFLVKIGAHIVHAPQEDSFAPGYYSVLFEDPDGTRLEINYVPGKGLLAPGTQIGGDYADGTQNG